MKRVVKFECGKRVGEMDVSAPALSPRAFMDSIGARLAPMLGALKIESVASAGRAEFIGSFKVKRSGESVRVSF